MEQYISKAALVAEIEKRINFNKTLNSHSRLDECKAILSFIDTLEVKEADFEKEYKNFINSDNGRSMFETAKHFYELGLHSTITEEDCKLIWNIGDEIPNMPEEEFFKELLRRYKAKKGE